MTRKRSDTRLIERWFPIASLGEECARERRSMTALPPTYYLHVWWARRPLVASRAAILASLLPEDADRGKFLHVLGIHGDPITARKSIDEARRTGVRVESPYGYERAFTYGPTFEDLQWIEDEILGNLSDVKILDPTAGGGSIPFEASRLRMFTFANDLNPVASLILRATVEWPGVHSHGIIEEFAAIASRWRQEVERRLACHFPQVGLPDRVDQTYMWARTIKCPYCAGLVPLSPNWRLAPNGTGVRLKPFLSSGPGSIGRKCSFEVVNSTKDQSSGTVSRGGGACPFTDCRRVIDSDDIKQQAQLGEMGEQLYAIAFKQRMPGKILKSGRRGKERWVRNYRAPEVTDDNIDQIKSHLETKLPQWVVFDFIPTERFPEVSNDDRPIRYGMPLWRDFFSPRQLFCHATSVEVFRELLEADHQTGSISDIRKAAYVYLSLALDKVCYYNCRMSVWHSGREVVSNIFSQHDYSFKWSYAEMNPLAVSMGYDWAINQITKCVAELADLVMSNSGADAADLFSEQEHPRVQQNPGAVTITCKSGDSLDHIENNSVDVIVMDPPYYDNVMYAELSDFFYVWLKRTAGHILPDLFRRNLTDKESEAVANFARFKGQKGAKALAGRDYQEKMGSVFRECRRVLKPNGVMTLMFTHKATNAWNALTIGLMEAGFIITASWPVNTESESSLHIRNRAAANSTVFLVCRPREESIGAKDDLYWEDVEPRVARAVKERTADFQNAGITGVDLYLASFGPALEEFSRYWPLPRGTPRDRSDGHSSRVQQTIFDDSADPYSTSPDDALDVARREVKRWRLEQLTRLRADADLDPPTAFFVLAWDAFKAPRFSYDEALRLSRAVGADLDREIVGRIVDKRGSEVIMLDSVQRAGKSMIGSIDGSHTLIDAIHHVANRARSQTLAEAKKLLDELLEFRGQTLISAIEAVLKVLPVSKTFTGIELEGEVGAFAYDFEMLVNLTRLGYRDRIDLPKDRLAGIELEWDE